MIFSQRCGVERMVFALMLKESARNKYHRVGPLGERGRVGWVGGSVDVGPLDPSVVGWSGDPPVLKNTWFRPPLQTRGGGVLDLRNQKAFFILHFALRCGR